MKFVPCDPFYRIFDHNGEKFDYNNDHEFTIKEIEKRSPGDVAGYEKFLKQLKPSFKKDLWSLPISHF